MDIFVVHSGRDFQKVDGLVKEFQAKAKNVNPLVLENGGKLWKIEAGKFIRQAQMVIFFIGETSFSSKNIGWELNESIKFKKPLYLVKLDDDNIMPNVLNRKNRFSKKFRVYGEEKKINEIIEKVNAHESGKYHVFNTDDIKGNEQLVFEQYKLFLNTSETLVERRQSVNSFYISVNTAIVTVAGVLFTLTDDLQSKLILGMVSSVVGIILSWSWVNILDSYGNLNSSKMKILSILESHLPASLFDAEWDVLSDKLNNKKYTSFTDSEKRIPKIFIFIYCLMIVAVVTYLLFF